MFSDGPLPINIKLADCETNGLLDKLDRVHLLTMSSPSPLDPVEVYRKNSAEDTIEVGLRRLMDADLIVFHNAVRFDIPAIQKVYPWFTPHWSKVIDTLLLSQLAYPDLMERDAKHRKTKEGKDYPGYMVGMHKLEAWGLRLGCLKGEYQGDTRIADEEARKALKWAEWNPDMEAYGIQDVVVLKALWGKLMERREKGWLNAQTVRIEHQVATIIARQERHGILFDAFKAAKLYAKLSQVREELKGKMAAVFPPRLLPDGPVFVPKRDNKKMGYVEGAAFQKLALTPFNPSSRQHVATWLKAMRGWVPTEFTGDGHPKVDDEVLGKLDFPEAKVLQEYYIVEKRIGQVGEGNQAWLKKVRNGRLHGRVDTIGAVTRRMTHKEPNLAQVPSGRAPYGHECRECFTVPKGKKQVGIDADALELRDLAGYMAFYDKGAYVETVLRGEKSKGTDMHSVNCRALGMDPKGKPHGDDETGRDIAKTWFYAFIYGAGDEKLGSIILRSKGKAAAKAGAAARAAFLKGLPAMGKLVKAVKERAKEVGYLKAIDGGRLLVRHQHAALNTLLQSAGAIQMKKALCLFDDALQARGWVPGVHYEFIANVHDEWQLEVDHDIAEQVGRMGADAIRLAGEHFSFGCPLAGNFDIGNNWAETH